jgi:hypothetical protein
MGWTRTGDVVPSLADAPFLLPSKNVEQLPNRVEAERGVDRQAHLASGTRKHKSSVMAWGGKGIRRSRSYAA